MDFFSLGSTFNLKIIGKIGNGTAKNFVLIFLKGRKKRDGLELIMEFPTNYLK